jgi:hypothetical protein
LTGACATGRISERDITDQTLEPTPPPSAHELDQPGAEDEDELRALLEAESGKPNGKTRQPGAKPQEPEKKPKPGAREDRSLDERDLPTDGEPTEGMGREPEIEPKPATPPAKRTVPRQGPLSQVSSSQMDKALSGAGGPKAKAALALTREGRQQMAENNAFLAEKRFEKALSVDPSCGQAYLGLAELRYSQEKWQQAAALASKAALRLNKQPYFLARAHVVAARALINGDRAQAGYQQVLKAVAADPDNEEARLLKISLEANLGIAP